VLALLHAPRFVACPPEELGTNSECMIVYDMVNLARAKEGTPR